MNPEDMWTVEPYTWPWGRTSWLMFPPRNTPRAVPLTAPYVETTAATVFLGRRAYGFATEESAHRAARKENEGLCHD